MGSHADMDAEPKTVQYSIMVCFIRIGAVGDDGAAVGSAAGDFLCDRGQYCGD